MSYRCIYQKFNSFNCSMLVLSLFVCDFIPPIISINREGVPVQFILQPLNTNIPSTVQSALVKMKGLLIITPCAALFVAIFDKFVFLTGFFFFLFLLLFLYFFTFLSCSYSSTCTFSRSSSLPHHHLLLLFLEWFHGLKVNRT